MNTPTNLSDAERLAEFFRDGGFSVLAGGRGHRLVTLPNPRSAKAHHVGTITPSGAYLWRLQCVQADAVMRKWRRHLEVKRILREDDRRAADELVRAGAGAVHESHLFVHDLKVGGAS